MDLEKGKITIGLPVYNAEKFLKKRIEGLLSQTFQNFEIIISDNFSTDSTKIICEEYVKKDPRIKIFEQKENLGWQKNFKFVLEKSNSEFFIWTASNDIWDDTFLEKNLEILKKDLGIIGSTSKIIQYGEINTERKTDNKLILMTKNYFSKYGTFNAKGTYDNRIRTYLSVRSAESIYSLFRTDILKKVLLKRKFQQWILQLF